MIYNTLEDASWAGRSEIAAGMAGVAYRETAGIHKLIGQVYPCGESFHHLSPIQVRTASLRMQTQGNESR